VDEDVKTTLANLHNLISQTETGLLVMRAEVGRLEKLIDSENTEPTILEKHIPAPAA
jgi:hypothetical protein